MFQTAKKHFLGALSWKWQSLISPAPSSVCQTKLLATLIRVCRRHRRILCLECKNIHSCMHACMHAAKFNQLKLSTCVYYDDVKDNFALYFERSPTRQKMANYRRQFGGMSLSYSPNNYSFIIFPCPLLRNGEERAAVVNRLYNIHIRYRCNRHIFLRDQLFMLALALH